MQARFCAGVVRSCQEQASGSGQPAQRVAVAADRFAREIVGFLTLTVMRSRLLNGNPLGRNPSLLVAFQTWLCYSGDMVMVRGF